MRLIKMLGLIAVAAVAVMASIAVSPAVAQETALCKEANVLACPPAQYYAAGTQVLATLLTGTTMQLLTSAFNITCSTADIHFTTLNALGSPLEGNLEELTFENCNHECENIAAENRGAFLLLKTAANLGEAKIHGMLIKVKCEMPVFNCNYVGGVMTLHAIGTTPTEPAMLKASAVALTKEGGMLCPVEARWDASYKIAPPEPVYITN
jgi:hypothetical protein